MNKKHYLSNEDISILCSELASVVSSGLTITDGILVILQDGEDKNKAALLEKILRSIETGSSITRAFDKTEVFPNYFNFRLHRYYNVRIYYSCIKFFFIFIHYTYYKYVSNDKGSRQRW